MRRPRRPRRPRPPSSKPWKKPSRGFTAKKAKPMGIGGGTVAALFRQGRLRGGLLVADRRDRPSAQRILHHRQHGGRRQGLRPHLFTRVNEERQSGLKGDKKTIAYAVVWDDAENMLIASDSFNRQYSLNIRLTTATADL